MSVTSTDIFLLPVIHSYIKSSNKGQDIVLGDGDPIVNKTEKGPVLELPC